MKQYIVIAFRYGSSSPSFPIGIYETKEKAVMGAKNHFCFRGGKYSHRIYEFELNKTDDNIGPRVNSFPCIEA